MPAVPFDALSSNVIVAAAMAAVAFAIGRWTNRPALAHAIWLLVLVKLVTPPLFNLPIRILPAVEPVVVENIEETISAPESVGPIHQIAIAAELPKEPARLPEPVLASATPVPVTAPWFTWRFGIFALWSFGCIAWLAVTFVHVRRFSRYLRFAVPAPESFVREVAAVARKLDLGVPRVKLLPGEVAPFIWSFGRTTLYFPENLRDRLSPEQRATVIAHELAHVWRRDHFVRWIEMLAVAAFWWFPLAWLARRELRRLEEDCCDAVVVANYPEAKTTYASAILDTIDFLAGSRPTPQVASGMGDASSLHRRLKRILDGIPPRLLARPTQLFLFAFAVVLLATGPRLARLTALAIQTQDVPALAKPIARESNDYAALEPVQFLPTPIRLVLPETQATATAAAQSPDGNLVALASGSDVIVWDLRNRRIAFTYRGHTSAVNAVAFSPDGLSVASAGNDAVVRIWSIDGSDQKLLDGHTNWIQSVAFSPDGQLLASAGYDKLIRFWNLASGEVVRILDGHSAVVRAVVFSPDGKWFASAGGDGTVKLWNPASGEDVRTITGHTAAVRTVAFSPDNTRLASAGDDRTVRISLLREGTAPPAIALPESVTALRFSARGSVLLAGTFGGHILNVNPNTGKLRGSVGPARPIHADSITALLPSPSGNLLLSVSHDGTIFAWPTAGLPESARQGFVGHSHLVTCVATSPDGNWLATGCLDGTIRIWNVANSKELRSFKAHVGGATSLTFLSNGRLLSVGNDENVRIWEVSNGTAVRNLSLPTADVKIAISPDAKRLAVVGPKIMGAMIWDIETGSVSRRIGSRLGGLTAVAFVPDDRLLAVGTPMGDMILLNPTTGKEEHRADISKDASVEQVAFTKFGERAALVLKHRDGTEEAGSYEVVLWNLRDKTAQDWPRQLLNDGPIHAVAFYRENASILTAGHDGHIAEWDAVTGQRLRSVHAHLEAVSGFNLLSGNTVISAGDRLAKLWEWPREKLP